MTPVIHRRRVAVVGGGPAGMEAARAAAERGHAVTLFEKERHLGGQLRLAVVPPFKRDLAGLWGYLRTQIQKKVEVKLQHEVCAEELLRGQFEVVILATGCLLPEPSRPGDPRAVKTWDVLSGKAKVDGNRIVVIGQSRVACETAELLCRRKGKKVTVLHPGPREDFGKDMEPIFERRLLLERLETSAVKIYHETSLIGFTPEGITVQGSLNGIIPCEQVVIDDFPVANHDLLEELQGRIAVTAIGDCAAPGDIYQAIHSGFQAGYRVS